MEVIKHQGKNFLIEALMDKINRRIWVADYSVRDHRALRAYLVEMALRKGLEKIVFPVRVTDEEKIKGPFLIREGSVRGYFNGEDASFLAAYPSPDRGCSGTLEGERDLLKKIFSDPGSVQKSIGDLTVRKAGREDLQSMADLFSRVFITYPTPVFDAHYLESALAKGDLYLVAQSGGLLVGVAAAEINREQGRAELTNCATDPGFRGRGVNTFLLREIEKICLSRGIKCLYSLARASSYGMNLVFHRLGYSFGGTLINNCHIGGRFENMNIWDRPN